MKSMANIDENNLIEVLDILDKYEKEIKDAESLFILEGRRLEEIMRTLPHNQVRYEKSLHELKALQDWLENIKDKLTAKYWKKYIEGYQKVLGTRDVQAYIAGEPKIVEVNQVIISTQVLKQQMDAIVEGFKQMGWSTGNITKLRVAELQETVL